MAHQPSNDYPSCDCGYARLLLKEPPKRASEFEQLTVVSQLVGPDGASLPQLVRSEYTLGARGFVLCDSCYLGAFAQSLAKSRPMS